MTTSDFIRFLDAGVSSHHVGREIVGRLEESGFRRLLPGESWRVERETCVYVEQAGSVIAFRAGTELPEDAGILMAAAHTDSPGLQLKPQSTRRVDGFLQVPVEVYGGPIHATWLDRELAVAGRVVVRHDDGSREMRYVHTKRPVAIIPNLAIHLNRDVNESVTYNRQDHLRALFGPLDEELGAPERTSHGKPEDGNAEEGTSTKGRTLFFERLGAFTGIDPTSVIEAELFLVPVEPAATMYGDDGVVVSPRIDNLAGCYTVLEAIRRAGPAAHGQLAVFFNHEEIGSATNVGAAGAMLETVLRRLVAAIPRGGGAVGDAVDRTVARSLLISNDGAHARHPNYADKHDPGYAPRLSGGPAVKKSAIWRYVGDLDAGAWFADVCREAGVPLQYLQNRSDIRAGSTIGPAVASRLGVRGLDVGVPMLAMHSVRETASLKDVRYMIEALTTALARNNDEILDPDSSR